MTKEVFVVTARHGGAFEGVFGSEDEADIFIDEQCECEDDVCDFEIEVRVVSF